LKRRKDTNHPVTPSKRISDAALLVHIKVTHAASKGEYGWPRIWRELHANRMSVWKVSPMQFESNWFAAQLKKAA
jgi:hypothetical protein